MANESAGSKMKASPSSSSSASAGDSYIGSIISLTSKFEIRYEGVLYYLNPQDSTLGLKSVRSYGTEGRKKDGPQIPASDKVYEYILFRGSDIKDLQVKSSPPSQAEESIQNDPAIIQSQSASGSSSLPKSSAPSGVSSIESRPYMEASTLNRSSYPNVAPSHQSGAQAGALGPQTAQKTMFSSSHTMPNSWSGYNVATDDYAYVQQQPIPSTVTSFPTLPNVQEVSPGQPPTNIAFPSSSNSLAQMQSLSASNSANSSIIPTLTPEQLSTNPENIFSSSIKTSLSSYPSIVANQVNMSSLPLSGQNGIRVQTPANVDIFADSMKMQSAHSVSYSASSLVDSASGSLLRQSQSLLNPAQVLQPRPSEISPAQNLYLELQPRTSEHFPAQNLYPDHGEMDVLNSASSSSLYSSTTPAAQAPSLQSKPPAQQYTEEFDFDAMNEKFKKDEVWGYLGKTKQRDKMEQIEDSATVHEKQGIEEGGSFVAEADAKPAYNKDEFFDTISCNSASQRGRNGQSRVPQRMRHDNENFGNFQQRLQPGYGGYTSGRGYNDPYSWGRGNHSGGRGRGGYPRWY